MATMMERGALYLDEESIVSLMSEDPYATTYTEGDEAELMDLIGLMFSVLNDEDISRLQGILNRMPAYEARDQIGDEVIQLVKDLS